MPNSFLQAKFKLDLNISTFFFWVWVCCRFFFKAICVTLFCYFNVLPWDNKCELLFMDLFRDRLQQREAETASRAQHPPKSTF